MLGNLAYINHKVAKNDKCPIKDFEKIEIINEMFWREFKKQIDTSSFPVLEVKHLGIFYTNNSSLRKYTRDLINIARRLRKSERYRLGYPQIVNMETDVTLKLRACWKQLESLRHVYLARKEKYGRNNIK
jgi:hypothetical protein